MTLAPAVRPHLASFETGSFVRPVHRLVWHPTPVPPSPGDVHRGDRPVRGRRLLVVGEVHALVAAVAQALRDAGAVVQQAVPGQDPAAGDWDGIVDLNVAGLAFGLRDGGWRDALARTVRMIQQRYPDWEREVRSDYCCYLAVTAMGGLMGYRDAGAGQPLGGIWAGLAKCLPRELPNLAIKVVDVQDTAPQAVAAAVLAELAGWDLFEIGVRDGVRHALAARRAPVPPARLQLGPDDLVLISGGARGVGFALARGLADRIGQIDYAAGNEALARLGFWARDALGLPVHTLCWPTWERLGVIANYDAAVRYVSTIAPADAVERWYRELAAAHTGEVMFIGQVGAALVPSQLRGFWLFTGHPDLPRLHALAHFLGRVEVFEPFRRIRSTRTYRAGSDPCLGDFQVDGDPAVPVSVLLEHACAVADWLMPPGWPVQHLTELREVTVHLPQLRFPAGGGLAFTVTAQGRQEPDGWTVHVTMTTAAGTAAKLSLLYRPEPVTDLGEVTVPDLRPADPPRTRSGRWSWAQLAIGPIRWQGDPAGERTARLPAVTAADLWTAVFPPSHGIAPAAIEAAVMAATAACEEADLRWSRLQVCPGAQRVTVLHRAGPGAPWSGLLGSQAVLRFVP